MADPRLAAKLAHYDYPAVLENASDVHDGDTLRLTVTADIGFDAKVSWRPKFRLARVNAPELRTATGPAARDFTLAWVQTHAAGLRVTVIGPDNYGDRWDAEVYDATTGANLSDALLASGNAVIYP